MLKTIPEHYNKFDESREIDFEGQLPINDVFYYQFSKTKFNKKKDCFRIYSDAKNEKHYLANSYFVGVDWIVENKCAIYVEPKLNNCDSQTNYLAMLTTALEDPEALQHTDELFEIKWDKVSIQISKSQDLLTPLLIIQFLKVVQRIVKKGLKKSYYKIEKNLSGKVKGKILVGSTIRKNHVTNNLLYNFCAYEEYGVNSYENRLLKKAFMIAQRNVGSFSNIDMRNSFADIAGYISPAFDEVTEEMNINNINFFAANTFYKDYEEGIRLAKLILKKEGYNIDKGNVNEKMSSPPFWIDMSKLFELYVLRQLKQKYGKNVHYQFKGQGTYLDFLINCDSEKLIVDAKYRPLYNKSYDIKDIRQLSGYARDVKVLDALGYSFSEQNSTVVKCLIVYPNQEASEDLWDGKENKIDSFSNFFKREIKLPLISK